MDLLEYQAKDLFREMGIPVLPGQRIDHPRDLKKLKIPYPVVLKSQVRSGGRAKAGGIKFVENTIDAVAAAQSIFSLPIMGEYPEVLLAEAQYNVEQELYLAIALDRSARRPVLLGSRQGGIGVESAIEQMQQVVVEQEFSPFYARRLVLKMGLQKHLIQSVSRVVEKMYRLFAQKDLDLLEINPLAVNPEEELMALDGKVSLNDDALGRHPELTVLNGRRSDRELDTTLMAEPEPMSLKRSLPLVELDGSIGILCNGAGLTMTTLDLVNHAGGRPANFLNIGTECYQSFPPLIAQEHLEQGLELVSKSRNIKVVLVNVIGSVAVCDRLAQAIANHIQNQSGDRQPHFVVRLAGNMPAASITQLEQSSVTLVETLDAAVNQAVTLTKASAKAS